ncbi:hypothetical protein PoB_005382900 [Plakobranchus ocellatus]|uniref:Uncharacterized protein n=1 Tax=Plakobranchus ocellatus TaxID=259542 RepID=A0AAV4C8D0_9GAST|nr:hypothetical protein PoB_005382900 [Plakobranchus ocellatus]
MNEMLPFHGKRHALKNLSGPTRQLMNEGRPRQRHSMTKAADVGNILLSSRRTNTADISVSTRGLGNFTTVTQGDSTGTKHNGNTQEAPRERPRESGYGRQQHLGSPREWSREGKYGRQRSRSPRERFRGGGRYKQRSESSRERSREEEYGRQQCSRSSSERSRESGDREPSPDIEKSGM